MLKVGITGGIGSGKTTVANIFLKLGIPVFFADIEAAKLISGNNTVKKKIAEQFGKQILSGEITDRKKLARVVFSDKKKLEVLNAIIHPAVRTEFKKWEKKHAHVPYIIQEAAILIETGIYKNLDYTILITAPENLRINRVMKRDEISGNDVYARIKNQWSDKKKKESADAVIINDDKKMILPQVLKIHKKLLDLAS